MKKIIIMFLCVAAAVSAAAQNYRFGLVKDEGGYTNIRKGPGTNYAVVGKVKDGSFILYHTDFNGFWYQVYTQQGKLRGYISASKVEQLESPEF